MEDLHGSRRSGRRMSSRNLKYVTENPPSLKIQGITKVDDPRNNDGAPRTEYEQQWYPSDIISTLHSFKYLKRSYRPRKERNMADDM